MLPLFVVGGGAMRAKDLRSLHFAEKRTIYFISLAPELASATPA
jgi:hypothetical protein